MPRSIIPSPWISDAGRRAGGEPLAATNLRQTSTREILYAFGDWCGTNGTMVYFLDVPAPPSVLTLTDSECVELDSDDDAGLAAFAEFQSAFTGH